MSKPAESPYVMILDLRVLDHLGINLYSNAAAVLSEAVANSWDADATTVKIDIDRDEIVIDDDGVGMNLKAINDRFLNVGYDKRAEEGERSAKGRAFMGRKGIGKLALFSIADHIEIHTVQGKERHAFRLRAKDLRAAIQRKKEYRPDPLPVVKRTKGTRIILSGLKKKRTANTPAALRKRIARRFSIIGVKQPKRGEFKVRVNGMAVDAADREDLKAIEFLWEFGDRQRIGAKDCPALKKRFLLPGTVREGKPDWKVRGWFGAAAKPKSLRHDEAGTMHGLVVLARGRLIQENILDKLAFSRILTSYLTGQIEADFLDAKGEVDIATSDRQRLIEDDERYVALTTFLRNQLVEVSDEWTRLRNELRGKEAISEHPVLGEWLQTLPVGQRKPAERMLGVIQGIELEDEGERRTFYKAGIVAFERLRLREESHRLGEIESVTADTILPLLADLASLEGSMYREIVKSRLDVIRKFESLVDDDAREKVLQKHLFENLWLLDPGWERAAGSARLEEILKRDYKAFDPKLTDEQSKGRVDIRYRTNGGEHIIVELKKAGRKMHLHELLEQGQKYYGALQKCLVSAGVPRPHISIVFVLGVPVHEEGEAGLPAGHVDKTLAGINARVEYYGKLIQGAHSQYAEYLERSAIADRIDKMLNKL